MLAFNCRACLWCPAASLRPTAARLPGWLDPSVYVFVAALVAAEQERVADSRRRLLGDTLAGWRGAVQGLWRRRQAGGGG